MENVKLPNKQDLEYPSIKMNVSPVKHMTNRHLLEMKRIARLFKRGDISKDQAKRMFNDYIYEAYGRYAVVELPYKKAC